MSHKLWSDRSSLHVFFTQPWYHYTNWLPNVKIADRPEDSDVILFLGGEDVNPILYGEDPHPRTQFNTERDKYELKFFDQAFKEGIPMLGICRGSQFICAMQPRGKLVQDQPNPGAHMMRTHDGLELMVSSTHHQAQYPFNMHAKDYKVLGWTENMLQRHEDGERKEMNPEKECEVVYYPKIRALGIQPHPEMLDYHSPANEWFRKVFYAMLNDELE